MLCCQRAAGKKALCYEKKGVQQALLFELRICLCVYFVVLFPSFFYVFFFRRV